MRLSQGLHRVHKAGGVEYAQQTGEKTDIDGYSSSRKLEHQESSTHKWERRSARLS